MLRRVLIFIGIVQVALGVAFIVPGAFQGLIGLAPAPGWVDWILVQTGGRFLAMGYGMFIAARQPERHLSWIRVMIGVQVIDWVGTIAYLGTGTMTFGQVPTAVIFPIVFIAVLITRAPWRPRSASDTPTVPSIA